MSKCLVHARECVDFVDAYQNWKDQDCPWCRIRELETHIEKWVFVTALQTFEDRERFRTESEKLLYSATETPAEPSGMDRWEAQNPPSTADSPSTFISNRSPETK